MFALVDKREPTRFGVKTMRKIFQIDGLDNSILSIGECKEPQRAAICIRDNQGNEIHMLIGRENFRELCSLSYDIHWTSESDAQEQDEKLPI